MTVFVMRAEGSLQQHGTLSHLLDAVSAAVRVFSAKKILMSDTILFPCHV